MRTNYSVSTVCGFASFLLGGVILIAWYLHIPTLIQVHPEFVAMQYNTALGFLVSGSGLLALNYSKNGFAKGSGIFLLLLGSLTLLQYIFGLNFGIDQLFMEHYINLKASHPGRMAPNTALSFLLVGISLLVASLAIDQTKRAREIGLPGGVVSALGIVALTGYLMEVETAYGWGHLTRMAVHTASGFMALGLGIVLYAWKIDTDEKTDIPLWMPFLVGLASLAITILLWQSIVSLQGSQDGKESLFPTIILVVGILISILLVKFVDLAIKARRYARETETMNINLEELVVDIRAAKEEAEIANKAKSEFLTNMSHELRTPLHQILGFADLAIQTSDVISKEKQLSYFSTIQESGKEMLALVVDLIDLCKLDAGGMDFNMQEKDLLEVVKVESMKIEKQLDERSLTLDVIQPQVKTTAMFDAKRIRQVVGNLFSNSIKFSQDGKTITVSFGTETLPAREGSPESIPAIAITVRDEGVGIPEDELEIIFDKFTQSSKTKTGAGGKGLGLAICKEIMTAHKGVITAENHPDGGAVLKVTLPIEPVVS